MVAKQEINILDPGLGLSESRDAGVICIGPSSSGTLNTLVSHSNPISAAADLGQGPLAEDVCYVLRRGGGPVRAIRCNASIDGAAGSVTKTAKPSGTGTGTVTVAGTPYDAYQVTLEITKDGTVATGEFRYRLDKSSTVLSGGTWSDSITIPSGGDYAIPNTNLTLTFVPGAGTPYFEDGDVHTFTCTAPYYSPTDLNNALAALTGKYREGIIHLSGEAPDATDGFAMFAAFNTALVGKEAVFQWFAGIMASGSDSESNLKTTYASASRHVHVCFDPATRMVSAKPFTGWSQPVRPMAVVLTGTASAVTISDDPARFPSGPEPAVLEIGHDEFVNPTMEDPPNKFVTMRTWSGESGYWLSSSRTKSPSGSDFVSLPLRRVMNHACATVYGGLLRYALTTLTVKKDGTLEERSALRVEKTINRLLDTELIKPNNLDSNPHVSAVAYRLDREFDVLTTRTIKGKVAIRPDAYAETIITDIGFTLDVGGN